MLGCTCQMPQSDFYYSPTFSKLPRILTLIFNERFCFSSFCYLTFRKPQWSKSVQELHTDNFNFHYREMLRQEYCNMFKNIKIKIYLELFSLLLNYVLTFHTHMDRKGLTVICYTLFIFPDWRMRSNHSISPVLWQGFLVAIDSSSIITSNCYLLFPLTLNSIRNSQVGFS